MKTKLLLIILSINAVTSFAETYYVAPGGDDKNPGTAPEKPWATLKHGFAALRSGDTLVLGEGEYPQADVALNGVPEKDEDISKPVVIRAARPHTAVIHGDVMLRAFAKTAGRNYVYQVPFKEKVGAVVESDTDIVYEPVISPDDLDETVASYFYDSKQELLFVHTTDGLPPEKHVLKALVDNTGINYRLPTGNINRARLIVFDGLVFKGFVFAGLDMRQVQNVTVTNCVFYHNCYGIYLSHALQCRILNNLFFANNIRRVGSAENAPLVVSGDVDDIVVDGNISRHNRFNSIRAYGETIPAGGQVVFSNNRSFGEAPLWFKPPAAGGAMIGNISEGFIRAYVNISNTCPGINTGGVENRPIESALVYTNTPATIAAAKFVDPVNEDYRLQADSPFRGTGAGGSDPGAFPYKGDVFFVKPDGNDKAQGTSVALAWRSLDKAVGRLQPGHTLYILAGTYRGGIRITQAGTAERPLILRRHGTGKVVLNGAGEEPYGIEITAAKHAQIEGLEIKGFKKTAIMGRDSEKILVRECLVHDNAEKGVSFEKCGGLVLKNNAVANNRIGIDLKSLRPGLELVNNILQGNRKTQLRLDKLPDDFYSNFNCWHGDSLARLGGKKCLSLGQLRERLGEGNGSIAADARFENEGKGDFRLQLGSPCRGRGQFERTIGRNDLMPVVPAKPEIEDVRVHYAGATTATITYWTPRVPSYSLVEYGLGAESWSTNELTFERRIFHIVNLTGLKPDREYRFRVGAKYPSESWIDYARRAWGQAGGPPADSVIYGGRLAFRTLADEPAGRRLYVAADGCDTNDGLSVAAAWQTLRKACREAHAGDTVTIGNGRYFETITPCNSGAGDDKRIVFRAETPRGAIIDGNDFKLPNAIKLIGKNYITLDGFRFEYQNANASGMSGINPWSAQVLMSQARFCALSNCYFSGADKFPGSAWTALMGVRLDDAEGAVIENNFFFFNTWTIWTTTDKVPRAGYVPPLIKNNTFFIQLIWALHVTGSNDCLKLRNNLFAEYHRIPIKSGWPYFGIWYPWDIKLDSDYNFFWWHNDKQVPENCKVGHWFVSGTKDYIDDLPGGLKAWQKATGQDKHSLEAFFPDNNLYHQLDFTVAGKPYQGKGENGADIGCTWVGRHTDQVVFGDRNSKVDIPPWKDNK